MRFILFCFIFAPEPLKGSLDQMLEFNSEFKEPLPKREVERVTRSAEKAWQAKSDAKANEEAVAKGYPGAGYNLKNSTIIRWLEITTEEQQHLKTIIDGNEKRRRKRERDKLQKSEERKSVSREMCLENEKEKTEDKLWQLKQAMQRYPKMSNRKLAVLLSVSESYVRKLKINL